MAFDNIEKIIKDKDINPDHRIESKEKAKSKEKILKKKLLILLIATLIASAGSMLIGVDYDFLWPVMGLRAPKLIGILMASFCIGAASMAFQAIVNNSIVTPGILGMNSMYSLTQTLVVFFLGTSSIFFINRNLSFILCLVIMVVLSVFIYTWLFKKTKYNVMYVLLAGTVLSTLFSSLQSSMVRIMDPTAYDTLLAKLVASFESVNSDIILISLSIIGFIIFVFRKEIKLLDIISLGKNNAINLGVNYDNTVRKLLIGVAAFIAVATAMVGPLSFLGIIVVNLSRELLKTYKHKYLIPASVMIGMIFLLISQIIVQHIFVYSVPISVFVNIGGGIYFMYLLFRGKRT